MPVKLMMCFLFLLVVISADGQRPADSVYSFVEIPPAFPGGESALMKYLVKNIKYPPVSADEGVTGISRIQFIIDAQGCVCNVRSMDTTKLRVLDIEVMKAVRMMPAWKPGINKQKKVAVQYFLPVFICPPEE
ncbi:energy transducer TonB [Chitinophaga sp.]|uniref:energy transducer TonB n=1 Tax=Chitinophaga sp. TaxID=1869181 RepID=UPI002CD37897|nr:energy transducer TonB [Chitinophaga sp.]HWV66705.1 energy transducer TonB [Chitinophaga sp.]